MNVKYLYITLCVLGVVLPLSQFLPWIIEHGLNVPLLIQELFSTRIGGFFGWDVIVSAFVLLLFILTEGKRIQMPMLWLPIVSTFSVGVSFGLPLFLYLRQVHIENSNNR